MRHRVIITDPADRNFRDHFHWIRERSPQGAEAWRARIIEAVRSLEIAPDRHALARESAAFPVDIRCLLSGKNRSAFRSSTRSKATRCGFWQSGDLPRIS
jgi:plasmid stabilization system protein ParE